MAWSEILFGSVILFFMSPAVVMLGIILADMAWHVVTFWLGLWKWGLRAFVNSCRRWRARRG